ncbi:MAG: hypothetical protein JWN84_2369 [Nocardioides sp.]|nr:hypothetical protein [Nocardioides sp.]
MKSPNRLARGVSLVAGLTLALTMAAPVSAQADEPPVVNRDLCLPELPLPLPIPCIPGLPELPLPELPLPEIPGLPGLPGLPGSATAPTATRATAITGEARTGSTLTATPPTWDQTTGVTTTYQWKRAGTAIAGATQTTYVVTADDVAKAVTVVATGRTSPTTATESPSPVVTPTTGAAPTASTKPDITGTSAIGSTLAVSSGTWTGPQSTYTYQWYRSRGRGAAPITGATGTTYQLTNADAGRKVVVLVFAARPGYETGFALSDLETVPQLASGIKVALVRKTVAPSQRATMRVAIAAADGSLGGKIDIFRKGRRIATLTVRPGGSTVRLPRMPAGVHTLTAVYRGDVGHRSSTSNAVRLKVVRPRR